MDKSVQVANYAVAFIDLLGQKNEMASHRLMPELKEEVIALVKRSVGKTIGLQKLATDYYSAFSEGPTIYGQLRPEFQRSLTDMAPAQLRMQRFSDGLMLYLSLAEGQGHSPVNSVFALLTTTGSLCLMALAGRAPIRAGLDIGWGVERDQKELYGAAVAHAYDLESKFAQWPRVAIGEGLTSYLAESERSSSDSMSARFRKEMAHLCLSFVDKDSDRQLILNYLGKSFTSAAQGQTRGDLVAMAQSFISTELEKWRSRGCAKLTERYERLSTYFRWQLLANPWPQSNVHRSR